MTDQCADDTERVQCPEYCCDIPFVNANEVVAHLQWDHNRSELEAERMVRRSLEADTERRGSE